MHAARAAHQSKLACLLAGDLHGAAGINVSLPSARELKKKAKSDPTIDVKGMGDSGEENVDPQTAGSRRKDAAGKAQSAKLTSNVLVELQVCVPMPRIPARSAAL